jgi:transcriptional regulator NrdR family protein
MGFNRIGPPCPECGSLMTDTLRTMRTLDGDFVRRRECPVCKHRFYTVQVKELIAPSNSVKWIKSRQYLVRWQQFRSQLESLFA